MQITIKPDKCVAKGSFHQGNTNLFSVESAGKQCVTNSVIALVYHQQIPINAWNMEHLDDVLFNGNLLYLNIRKREDYLLISEIPDDIYLHEKHYKILPLPPVYGSLSETSSPLSTPLHIAIETLVAEKRTFFCIASFGDDLGAYSFVIMAYHKNIYIFDAHSRNDAGLPVAEGTSVVLEFWTCSKVIKYLEHLANLLKCTQYELTEMCIFADNSYSNVSIKHLLI